MDGDLEQRIAIVEAEVANALDAGGQGDAAERAALVEYTTLEYTQLGGQGDATEARRDKTVGRKHLDALGDGDVMERAVGHKCSVANVLQPTG